MEETSKDKFQRNTYTTVNFPYKELHVAFYFRSNYKTVTSQNRTTNARKTNKITYLPLITHQKCVPIKHTHITPSTKDENFTQNLYPSHIQTYSLLYVTRGEESASRFPTAVARGCLKIFSVSQFEFCFTVRFNDLYIQCCVEVRAV